MLGTSLKSIENSNMIETPRYYKIAGTGILYAKEVSLDTTFQVFLVNQETVIYCKIDKSPKNTIDIDYSMDWSLKGKTDDRQNFFATNLLITELDDDFIELISNNNIIIGDFFDFSANRIIYPLNNLFDVDFKTLINGFNIEKRCNKEHILKNVSKYWKIPQIGCELIIEKKNEPIESYTKIANYIVKLLSLATGRQLSIGIQAFISDSKCFTLLQNNLASSNYLSPLLANNDLPILLESGIPILQSWDLEKFKDFRIILEFLNATDKGYLDDRVLSLVQCYEIIAHNWLKLKYDLPDELKELKKLLKCTLKNWKKEYPDYDSNGFWAGRLHKSLEWEKTVKLLENVLVSQSLDLDKLNVDFTKLVELRHAVAHTGRFENEKPFDNMLNGQFALRIFLLKILGFNGKVNDYRGKSWIEYKDLSHFESMASA